MYGVTRIDCCEDVSLVTYRGIPASVTVISDVFDHFSEGGVNIDMISQSAPGGNTVDLSFTCLGQDLVKVLSLTKSLSDIHPDIKPRVISDNCKIQLFGEEMRTMHGVFAKAISSLRGIPVELRLVTTSEVDISLLVDSAHLQDTLDALRSTFSI